MKYTTYSHYRDLAKLNDCAIAKAINIPPQTLYQWRDKKTTPKIETKKLIAKYLKIPTGKILEDDN